MKRLILLLCTVFVLSGCKTTVNDVQLSNFAGNEVPQSAVIEDLVPETTVSTTEEINQETTEDASNIASEILTGMFTPAENNGSIDDFPSIFVQGAIDFAVQDKTNQIQPAQMLYIPFKFNETKLTSETSLDFDTYASSIPSFSKKGEENGNLIYIFGNEYIIFKNGYISEVYFGEGTKNNFSIFNFKIGDSLSAVNERFNTKFTIGTEESTVVRIIDTEYRAQLSIVFNNKEEITEIGFMVPEKTHDDFYENIWGSNMNHFINVNA